MGRHKRVAGSAFWIGVLLLGGCSSVDHVYLLKQVLLDHGFEYIWTTTLNSDQFSSTLLGVAHGTGDQNPPKNLEVHHVYLFYPVRQTNFEELGLHDLPARISEAGCTISSGPSRAADLAYPFVGGPTFVIRFSCRREGYELRAVVDPQLGSARGTANTTALVLIRDR